MTPASEIKGGMVLRLDGQLFQVVLSDFHQGTGKMGGQQHVKIRNLATGHVLERRYRPDEKLEVVEVDRRRLEYSYQDGEFHVFMDPETFDQVPIHRDLLEGKIPFLKEELPVTGIFHEKRPLTLQFPEFVDLEVTTSPPPIHEQETSTPKSVTLENGMEILVPPFIKEGDRVRVNVETGKYMERV